MADEIKLLESLIDQDADSKEFQAKAVELEESGKAEREKVQAQVDKKGAKDAKKGAKGAKGAKSKKQAKKQEDTDEDDSE